MIIVILMLQSNVNENSVNFHMFLGRADRAKVTKLK